MKSSKKQISNAGDSVAPPKVIAQKKEETEDRKFVYAKKKQGTEGRNVDLFVNFFKINIDKESPPYFHYNIEIVGQTEPSSILQPVPSQQSAPSTSKGAAAGKAPGKSRKALQRAKQQQIAPQQPSPSTQQQLTVVKSKSDIPKNKRTPIKLNQEIFKKIFETYGNIFQLDRSKALPVFDGKKNFYSTCKFNLPNNQWTGDVQVLDKDKMLNIRVNITIPEVSHDQNLKSPVSPFELQALDIILRNGLRLNKIAIGSNFFFKSNDSRASKDQFRIGKFPYTDPIKFGQFGNYQSARSTENGLFLNVDRSMAIFTRGGRLTEILREIIKGELNLNSILQKRGHFINLKFRALHLAYNRTFQIGGFSHTSIGETFFDKDDQKISVFKYFTEQYPEFCQRFKLNKNWPCVRVGSMKRSNYYPLESIELEADEVYREKLSDIQQGDVTRKSSEQTPLERFASIESYIKTIEKDNMTIDGVNNLAKFGIKIDSNKTKIKGRILEPPKIEYKNARNEPLFIDTLARGDWRMENVQFYNPSVIRNNWALVSISKVNGNRIGFPDDNAKKLIKNLIEMARNNGINLSHPSTTMFQMDYRRGCLESSLFDKLPKDTKLCIILIPKNSDLYNEIKTISELNRGLVTQCISQDGRYWNTNNPRDDLSKQLISNIFLKINPKAGGTNNFIQTTLPAQMLKNLMFVGLDVTHPSPTDKLRMSIAACVATYNKTFDRCFHRIVVQERARKELVSLKEIMISLLNDYKQVNKLYPEKIIFYRDGIGEGDFENVVKSELKNLKLACEQLKTKIKVTWIMVQKRHNTRFIPCGAKESDRNQNVKPGTVVDKEIVDHKLFEFYLCSHAGLKGTSRPAKYVCLYDDNNFSADEIQKITYHTCYLFHRCTKSLSIVPFVQYSHLLAKRGKSYLMHLEGNSDASSLASGNSRNEEFSKSEIDKKNQKIVVRPELSGTAFFI